MLEQQKYSKIPLHFKGCMDCLEAWTETCCTGKDTTEIPSQKNICGAIKIGLKICQVTNIVQCLPGKDTGIGVKLQTMRAAVQTAPSKARAVGLPETLGVQPLHQCAQDVGHGVNEHYSLTLRFNIFPDGLLACFEKVTLFFLFLPFRMRMCTHFLLHYCTLGADNLFLILEPYSWKKFALSLR